MELKLLELELELELKVFLYIYYLIETYNFETVPIILCLLTSLSYRLSEVLKYKDHDFFDFVQTIQGEIFCPLGP